MEERTNLKDQYVAYYRVSTEKQDLDTQRFILRNYLEEDYICAEFCEIESGKHMSTNEQLGHAIDYCKKNSKILVVALIDRLGRDTEHALKVHRELDGWIHACNFPMSLGSKMDRMMLTFFMAFAEKERELISLRTKQGLAKRVAEGVKLGPKRPFTGKRRMEVVQKARRTKLEKRFNDEKYHAAKDFIIKRVDERVEKEGKPARKYYSRNFDDVYQEIADELNSLKVPVPDYLRERDKWLSRQVYKIYRDETKKVTLQYQLDILIRKSEGGDQQQAGLFISKQQDTRKSG